MNCKCDTCIHHCGETYSSFEMNCIDHDFCSYERDESKPLYNMEIIEKTLASCIEYLNEHELNNETEVYVVSGLRMALDEMRKM